MTAMDAIVVDERDVISFLRGRKKAHDRRSTVDRLINVYMGMFGLFYVGLVVAGFVDADSIPEPGVFIDALVWLPIALLGFMWAVLRFATWQGPVVFSEPDLQWVMAAPLERRALVMMRLRRAFVASAVAGIIGGGIVAVVVDVLLGEEQLVIFLIAAGTFAAVALLATALSWHVERSVKSSALVNRAAPAALLLACILAAAVATGHEGFVWWSGPWGWAIGPIADRAGWLVPGWPLQLGLLALATCAAVASAVAGAGRFSEEELWRRAAARSVASAAMFFGDIRTLSSVSRRERTGGRFRARRSRMARSSSPSLAIASRDVLLLRRSPRLVATSVVFMVGAAAASVAARDHALLGVVAFLCLYVAASRLVEAIRIEADQADAHRLLPWSWGTVLVMHCQVPTVVMTLLGWTSLAVVGLGGFAPWTALGPFVVVAPFAAAAVVGSAAIASARQRFPVGMLVGGNESGGLLLFLWLVVGPLIAGIVLNVALAMMRPDIGSGVGSATVVAAGFLFAASFGLLTWLRTRKVPG